MTETKAKRQHKRKPDSARDPEDVDTCDPVALAWRAARYRQAAALAMDGRRQRYAVRALVRAGCAEADALEIVGRVFATYAER